jgi:hypothetical protein
LGSTKIFENSVILEVGFLDSRILNFNFPKIQLSEAPEFSKMKRRVLVVGCGVIGLTTGLTLLREGHEVALITKNTPPDTTSNAAGAFWYPVLDEPCSSLRNQLALATYNYMHTHILCKHSDAACVARMIDTYYNLELAAPHEDAVCFALS